MADYESDLKAIGKPHPYPNGLDKVAPEDDDADDKKDKLTSDTNTKEY
ncbi:MAG TPA: hypothetical protein VNZ45_03030 [Bacteroidia bacterium]|jgi:hypothetical protein|nr:hypothetical protein [Bacteroidia bacterium]